MKNFFAILLLSLSLPALALGPRGSYTEGTLTDAECLQESGEGYMQLFRDMERIWGASDLVNMIVETGKDMASRYPGRDRLQVEDMSVREGGDVSGHASHENGLDVDLQFFKADGREHVPRGPGDFAPSMVNADGSVSSNFDIERNWELMKSLHRHGRVTRIFIDEKLKAAICRHAREKGELSSSANVLRSMVHQTNHQDHLHVRLQCPVNSGRQCTNTPPRTSGPTGC